MKTKTPRMFKIDWFTGFVVMTAMFVALLFYTVILSLQVRQVIKATYKKMMMDKIAHSTIDAKPSMPITTTPSPLSSTNTQFKGKHFEIMIPAYWTIEAYAYPQNTPESLEIFSLVNTKSEMMQLNGNGTAPKEQLFLRIIGKKPFTVYTYDKNAKPSPITKTFPTILKDRVQYFTGFDMGETDTIFINAKPVQIGFGGGEGSFGWYTFIENANYVAAFQSENSDSKDKTKLYPGVGIQKEIISSLKFTE